MNRSTYIEINLDNIKYNVNQIINKYNNYKYYFGVIKADCYGHGLSSISAMIEAGVNYLVVATFEEALEIRKYNEDISILCLGIIKNDNIDLANMNNITISVTSIDYLNSIDVSKLSNSKVHIKVNTGMNRLGVSNNEEFIQVYNVLRKNGANIEGIYSHIYEALNEEVTKKQFKLFHDIISSIDLNTIKIIHIQASEALVKYEKKSYINGCRLGIIMYGFTSDKSLKLKSTFKVISEIIQINKLSKCGTVGYDGEYMALNDKEKIAVVPIGYADGIIRKNTGRNVYINNKSYKIIGNICMDMLFVKVDEDVKMFDKVVILKDVSHILEVAKYLETIPYEIICSIGKRVPRKYV